MIYFKNGVRIYPNLNTKENKHPTLFFTQSFHELKKKWDKEETLVEFSILKHNQTHLSISGDYPNLDTYCKELKVSKARFLKMLLTRELFSTKYLGENSYIPAIDETVNVYVNAEDYWDLWFIYMIAIYTSGRVNLIHNLYNATRLWFYVGFGMSGLSASVFECDSEYAKENFDPFRIVEKKEIIEKINSYVNEVPFSITEDKAFELELPKVLLGQKSEVVERVAKVALRETILDDLIRYHDSVKLHRKENDHSETELKWLKQIAKNPNVLDEIPIDTLNDIYNASLQFEHGCNINVDISYIKGETGFTEKLIDELNHSGFNIAAITTPDRAPTINSIIVSDILKNKDNPEYLKQFL